MSDVSNDKRERDKDKEQGAKVLRSLYAVHKNVRLYTPDHPTAKDAGAKFVAVFSESLTSRLDMTFRHADGLFFMDDHFYIEESLAMYDFLHLLEERSVTSATIIGGVTAEEAIAFCHALSQKESGGKSAALQFKSAHIRPSSGDDTYANEKSSTRATASFDRARRALTEWAGIADKIIGKLLDDQTIAVSEVAVALDRLIDLLTQNPAAFAGAIATAPPTGQTGEHAAVTMVLSIYIGQQIGYDATSLKLLAISALVHDVGRVLLPSDFGPDAALSESDVQFVRLHANDGATFLAGVAGLPMCCVRSALEHHMGFDGRGYPSLGSRQHPHLFSQIVALADFVSWGTTSDKVYRRPKPLHRLLRAVLHRSGSQFNPMIVKLFLPFFGLYPPGTVVRLTSGEDAVVVESVPANMMRPNVVVRGASGAWTFRRLSDLAPSGASFASGVAGVRGFTRQLEALLPFVPDAEPTPAR